MNRQEKLSALRLLMKQHQLDYYWVPGSDPHQNEYVPALWQRRTAISGFDGSNGDVLIGLNHAYLWTDGRYELQASKQLAPDTFQVFIFAQGSNNTLGDFFKTQAQSIRVGVDASVVNIDMAQKLKTCLEKNKGELVYVPINLVDSVEPPAAFTPQAIQILGEAFTGCPAHHKIEALQTYLGKKKIEAMVLSDLASIAWLFNLRGSDIPFNPLFLSYALLAQNEVILYLHKSVINADIQSYLNKLGVRILAYSDFYSSLSQVHYQTITLDPKISNQAIFLALSDKNIVYETNPIELWKAIKNPIEIEGASEAHRLDALALVQFFSWLDQNGEGESECSISEKLLHYRSKAASFQSPSFASIVGYAENGAIIHYHAQPKQDKKIGKDALLLIDSGGQYLEGTTDITRTVHLGQPQAFEKECYTLVLKGQLALRRAIFPAGTRGEHLDVLARQFLWQKHFNYAHGTGHGVGAYLCVHEGPQRISTGATTTPLQAGMIVSNEPGIYRVGQFGIRIEDLMYVTLHPHSIPEAPFYAFENLSLVPYAQKLIEPSLLSEQDRLDINAYHDKIWKCLSPHLEGEPLNWLKQATQAI